MYLTYLISTVGGGNNREQSLGSVLLPTVHKTENSISRNMWCLEQRCVDSG